MHEMQWILIDFYIGLGVKRDNNKLMYLIDFNDTQVVEELSSEQGASYQPQKIIKFFEKQLVWVKPDVEANHNMLPIVSDNTDGDPQQIICNFIFHYYFC